MMSMMYIDPGTGAMLFTTMIGLVATASFAAKKVFIKAKFMLAGGRTKGEDFDKKLPIVIFSESKRYNNVFESICDELEKRQQESYYWTASKDDPFLEKDYKYVKCSFIGEGNRAYAKLNMMNANICLSTTPGLDVYQWKKSRKTDCYVHTSHEIGGYLHYRMFGIDFYDSILLNGDFQGEEIRKIEKLRNLPEKELVTVGATFMDQLKDKLDRSGTSSEQSSNKTVLLAPSWGPSSILNKYGAEFLGYLKNTGYNIVVRPHPQSKTSEKELLDKLEKQFPENEKWHWNYDNDNFDVLKNSDIMITDFSGVIFDYALVFDGPVIIANSDFDESIYDACWLDEPTWRLAILPKIGHELAADDISNIKQVIDETISSSVLSEGREIARHEAWMYQGEGAVKTVDYLVHKLETLRKEEKLDA